jgi:hypothetical protein
VLLPLDVACSEPPDVALSALGEVVEGSGLALVRPGVPPV